MAEGLFRGASFRGKVVMRTVTGIRWREEVMMVVVMMMQPVLMRRWLGAGSLWQLCGDLNQGRQWA
jgi:hypothetical protein